MAKTQQLTFATIPLDFDREALHRYDPTQIDEVDKVKDCIQSECKKIADFMFPQVKVRNIDFSVNYDNQTYSYRVLLSFGLGKSFRSIGNELEPLKSTKQVHEQFIEFLKGIDRQLYVR